MAQVDEGGPPEPVSGSGASARPSEPARTIDAFRNLVGELIEHIPSPMFAIDGSGRVFEANSRFEALLGVSRAEIVERLLHESFAAPETRDALRTDLERVRLGTLTTIKVVFDAARGARVEASCDVRRYGKAEASPWLVTVVESRVVERGPSAPAFSALSYRVAESPSGALLLTDHTSAGMPCHEVLYQRGSRCSECPIGEALASGRSVESAHMSAESGLVLVVRATPTGASSAALERVFLPLSAVDRIARARVDARIEAARLSAREKDVLTYLRLGRSLEEVASVLSISHHTVKFHTANLLQKLGAESRLDLIRILG